jgi:hypothetical protein
VTDVTATTPETGGRMPWRLPSKPHVGTTGRDNAKMLTDAIAPQRGLSSLPLSDAGRPLPGAALFMVEVSEL